MSEICFKCGGLCCKVGYIIQVFPDDEIYGDDRYVHIIPKGGMDDDDGEFHHMKSNGDGYTCVALNSDNKCTIWHKRPRICREYAVDGPRCTTLRKTNEKS